MDFAMVAKEARGRWPSILSGLGVDSDLLTDRHSKCPGCGGKDRFRFDDREGTGSWICSQGGGGIVSGDGFDLLGHVHGWEKGRCLREVASHLGIEVRDHRPRPQRESGVAPAPVKESTGRKRKPFDLFALRYFADGCREDVSREWLASRSPVRPEWGSRPGLGVDFLTFLYGRDETVLVFTDFRSQGDFAYRNGRTYRLGQRPGVKPVRSDLPTKGKDGIWFLTNPVTGTWEPMQGAKVGRRHGGCVTSWRYAVLESDEAPADLWLRALVQLELKISAIYSSGGKSIHALVRLDARNKGEFDACRDMLVATLCKLGADGGALSGVRLSRLPGCERGSRGVQELYYLDPDPEWGRILDRPVLR